MCRARATAVLLAGVLALSGCGSGDDPADTSGATATPTPTPAAGATAPDALRGSWARNMTARAWRPLGRGYPLGTWRLDIHANGDMDVYLPRTDEIDFTTKVDAKGEQLTIDSIPICPGETGQYTWRASGEKLTLTVVADDGCKPRAALFGGTWTRR